MLISITAVRLRKLRYFFPLTWKALGITLQTRQSKGFLKMKNTGFGHLHYVITSWESEEDMINFMRAGAHGKAMKDIATLASEMYSVHYEADEFPSWKEAKERVLAGKMIRY